MSKQYKSIPRFTKEQIAWLERTFPESTHKPTDDRDMYIQLGKRQVIQHIKTVNDKGG